MRREQRRGRDAASDCRLRLQPPAGRATRLLLLLLLLVEAELVVRHDLADDGLRLVCDQDEVELPLLQRGQGGGREGAGRGEARGGRQGGAPERGGGVRPRAGCGPGCGWGFGGHRRHCPRERHARTGPCARRKRPRLSPLRISTRLRCGERVGLGHDAEHLVRPAGDVHLGTRKWLRRGGGERTASDAEAAPARASRRMRSPR